MGFYAKYHVDQFLCHYVNHVLVITTLLNGTIENYCGQDLRINIDEHFILIDLVGLLITYNAQHILQFVHIVRISLTFEQIYQLSIIM